MTASRAVSGYEGSIVVAAFKGASSSLGGVGSAGDWTGAPSVSVSAPVAGSSVWAVGHDWDAGEWRRIGSDQTMVHQFVDTSIGDTSWVQRSNSVTASSGAKVTLSDVAPTTNCWNLAAIAIRPA